MPRWIWVSNNFARLVRDFYYATYFFSTWLYACIFQQIFKIVLYSIDTGEVHSDTHNMLIDATKQKKQITL